MNVLQVSLMALSALMVTPSQASHEKFGSHETFVIVDPNDEWAIRKSAVRRGDDYGADPSPPYRNSDGHLAIDVNVWLSDGDYVFDVYYKANPNFYIQIDATNNWNNGHPEPKVRGRIGCQGDLKVIKQVDTYHVVYAITPSLTTKTAVLTSSEGTGSAAPASGDHDGKPLSPIETFVIFDSKDEWAIRKSTKSTGSDYGADPSKPYRTQEGHLAIDVTIWDSDGDYFFDVYYKADPNIYIQIDASEIPFTGKLAPQVTGRVDCKGDLKVLTRVNKYHVVYAVTPSLATKTAGFMSAEATGSAAPASKDHDERHLPSPTFPGFNTEDCWSCLSAGDATNARAAAAVGDNWECPCADQPRKKIGTGSTGSSFPSYGFVADWFTDLIENKKAFQNLPSSGAMDELTKEITEGLQSAFGKDIVWNVSIHLAQRIPADPSLKESYQMAPINNSGTLQLNYVGPDVELMYLVVFWSTS